MTEYEIIDVICDSVNPVLLLVAVGIAVTWAIKRHYRKAGIVFCLLVGGLLMTYGLMFLDTKLGLWDSFGGDYSTHTAFAIAAAIAISIGMPWGRWLILVLALYGIAMLYQQYHTVPDIVSTALVIGGPLLLARQYCDTLIRQQVAKIDS